jgi:hypothetical protein
VWIIQSKESPELRREFSSRKKAHQKAYQWNITYREIIFLYCDDRLVKTYEAPAETVAHKWYMEHRLV